ncbi:MAG: BlaI/MecI/CopY family transcriptional regulator [Candidatus Eremiobacteraeota bacterium]|nr:BlaI/MecI/CopY family transcriptional regulator [Candidatus Eremiobacteraeota bacterium]
MARRRTHGLTDAELRLMEVLWRDGPAKVSDVVDALPPPALSYSSVLTTLRILERKGYVAHEQLDRAYLYRAVVAREAAAETAVGHLVNRFFSDSPVELALQLVERDRPSEDELQRLRALIERYEEDAS